MNRNHGIVLTFVRFTKKKRTQEKREKNSGKNTIRNFPRKSHSAQGIQRLGLSLSYFCVFFLLTVLYFSQIFLGGFLETTSLCYITMVLLTVVPITPDAIILLMCSLPIVSAMWQAIKSRSRWNTRAGKLDVIKFGTSASLAVIGVALLLNKVTTKQAM